MTLPRLSPGGLTLLSYLLIATVGSAAQTPPLTATLQLLPDTALPGTPVAFMITLTNPGDRVAKIANALSLHVATASSTFDALGLVSRDTVSLPTAQMERFGTAGVYEFTVPAHGQRTIYIDIGPHLSDNEFFADHRLSFPGEFLLSAELTSYLPLGGTTTAVTTNAARLRIETPAGVDAEAWQFLQEQTAGTGWGTLEWINAGDKIAPALRSKFPGSRYLMWVAAMGTSRSQIDLIGPIDAALSAGPPPSLRDDLLWAKAATLAEASGNALGAERDIDKAVLLADQSRQAYTRLKDEAVSAYLRSVGVEALQHLYTRRSAEDDLRRFADSDAPAVDRVVPHVECVSKGEGQSFGARFGYSNPNGAAKAIGISNLNQVTPAPRDQGQPKVFKPGNHANVFTANSPGGNLTWHLDGAKAVASPDFPIQCQAVPIP